MGTNLSYLPCKLDVKCATNLPFTSLGSFAVDDASLFVGGEASTKIVFELEAILFWYQRSWWYKLDFSIVKI